MLIHELKPSKIPCSGSRYVGDHWFCNDCAGCNTVGCQCYKPHSGTDRVIFAPLTQKARGVIALRQLENLDLLQIEALRVISILRAKDAMFMTVKELEGKAFIPAFARPCPTSPKHGFVESKVVSSVEEIVEMAREVHKQDSNGEIILCAFIDSRYNVVWRTNGMTIGRGHAGATSGVGAVDVPLVELPSLGLAHSLIKAAGVENSPFMELVQDKNKRWIATQLRDGPEVCSVADYIPQMVAVSQVIVLDREVDLLEWAATVASSGLGTVVYNKGCFGMGSHYAVHCVLHGVPFVKSFKPRIGQILQPNENVKELDKDSFVEGLTLGFLTETNGFSWEELGVFSLAALHNTPAFVERDSKYIGFGAAIAVRLGLMALYGESRHRAPDDEPGRVDLDRGYIYELSWRCLKESLEGLPEIRRRWRRWPSSTSVGGKKWAVCQTVLEKLCSAILRAAKARKRWKVDAMRDVIVKYNTMINTAHNGGKWFNKFYHTKWMDVAALTPACAAIKTANVFYEVAKMKAPTIGLKEAMNSTTGEIKSPFCPWLLGEKTHE